MSKLLVVILLGFITTLPGSSPLPQQGWSFYYSPGIMERVYAHRVAWHQIPPNTPHYDGYASTPDCRNIGKYVWAIFQNPVNKKWSGVQQLLIVDCSRPSDLPAQRARGLVLEVDYQTATRNGFIGEGKGLVQILQQRPVVQSPILSTTNLGTRPRAW